MSRLQKAVCLMSGGPDAAVAAAWARSQGAEVHPLYVDHGQHAHLREIECATGIASWLGGAPLRVTKLGLYGELTASATTSAGGRSTTTHPISEYIPFRNSLLLSLAVAMAEAIHADSVVIGSIAGPWVTPDNSPDYFVALNELVSRGTLPESNVRVLAPLNEFSKTKVIATAVANQVPLELTWSCHNNVDVPCSDCGNCRARAEAFAELRIDDPLLATVR